MDENRILAGVVVDLGTSNRSQRQKPASCENESGDQPPPDNSCHLIFVPKAMLID